THAKLKRTGEDDVEGRDLRDLNPNSFTCDFDLSSVCEAGDWDIVLYDSLDRTTTAASIWFNVFSPEMQHLTWTSAPAGNLNTGTQNNLVGQIN
ncbi:hypothetical protein KAR10_09170, partial [bacterium]|nr:hypothetical protein [bacterium]